LRCLVGIDDTDSARGYCTTYLAYRIAASARDEYKVLPYPRLVRLNPNIPFKTRGNAAVCLRVETKNPDKAFKSICTTAAKFSDEEGGANTGLVLLEDLDLVRELRPLYLAALCGVVNVHRVTRFLRQHNVKFWTQGNGMGLVGATSSLVFDESFDHTYELISYRRRDSWGKPRDIDASSVRMMDAATFPHTFNNYDYQKRKVLIAPHGPDPVFAGVRGDSPGVVLSAFRMLAYDEPLDGHMIYLSNQHTEAHLDGKLDWKVYSSGWAVGKVERVDVGPGGHVYISIRSGRIRHLCAVYEPTGDLRRVARRLKEGDAARFYGGVRKATSIHPKVLNVERMDVLKLAQRGPRTGVVCGTYVASPRANRHLTKPLIRYGNEVPGVRIGEVEGWLSGEFQTDSSARSNPPSPPLPPRHPSSKRAVQP
jgi:tRNA(Ile2)-agmatinylcytidine synthase